jgi:hypothetical protein
MSDKKKSAPSSRKPRKAERPYVKQPELEPASLTEAVDEGALIARSTLVMEVKNHIILLTLRDSQALDRAEAADFVSHEFVDLAEEQKGYARRMEHAADIAERGEGSALDREGYRSLDAPALVRRAAISHALAEELERQSRDQTSIDEVVEAARLRAWAEVSQVIEDRLDALYQLPVGADYERDRDERIAAFLALDFAALEPPPRRRAR